MNVIMGWEEKNRGTQYPKSVVGPAPPPPVDLTVTERTLSCLVSFGHNQPSFNVVVCRDVPWWRIPAPTSLGIPLQPLPPRASRSRCSKQTTLRSNLPQLQLSSQRVLPETRCPKTLRSRRRWAAQLGAVARAQRVARAAVSRGRNAHLVFAAFGLLRSAGGMLNETETCVYMYVCCWGFAQEADTMLDLQACTCLAVGVKEASAPELGAHQVHDYVVHHAWCRHMLLPQYIATALL